MKLDGAKERLKLFESCDLTKAGSLDAAIQGCCAVLHTASPFFMQGGSEEALVVPAVEGSPLDHNHISALLIFPETGTKKVLDACQRLGVKGPLLV